MLKIHASNLPKRYMCVYVRACGERDDIKCQLYGFFLDKL